MMHTIKIKEGLVRPIPQMPFKASSKTHADEPTLRFGLNYPASRHRVDGSHGFQEAEIRYANPA